MIENYSQPNKYFYEMPMEIYVNIISTLDVKSLMNISLTCKKFYNYSYYSKNENAKRIFECAFNKKIELLYSSNPNKIVPFCQKVGIFSNMPRSTAILGIVSALESREFLDTFEFESTEFYYREIIFHIAGMQGILNFFEIQKVHQLYELRTFFISACQYGQIEIVNDMIKNRHYTTDFVLAGILIALKNRQETVVNRLLELFNKKEAYNFAIKFMINCIDSKNFEFIEKIFQKYTEIIQISKWEFYKGFLNSLNNLDLKTLKWLLNFSDSYYNKGKKHKNFISIDDLTKLNKNAIKFLIEDERVNLLEFSFSLSSLFKLLELKKIDSLNLILNNLVIANFLGGEEEKFFLNFLMAISIKSKDFTSKDIDELLMPCTKKEITFYGIFHSLLRVAINFKRYSLLEKLLKKNRICKICELGKIKLIETLKVLFKKRDPKSVEIFLKYFSLEEVEFHSDQLYIACIKYGTVEILEQCLKKIEFVNNFNFDQVTYHLCQNGNIEMMQFIIKEFMENKFIHKPDMCLIAHQNNQIEMALFLINEYSKINFIKNLYKQKKIYV